MTQSYTVFPMRSSGNPAAMTAFLELLGLHKATGGDLGTNAVFEGASGSVAVRDLTDTGSDRTPGETTLHLAVADIEAAMAELSGAGLEGLVAGETSERRGVVRMPDGTVIGLSECRRGPSGGFRVHEQVVAASLDIVAVCTSIDFHIDAAFFAFFGFEPFGSLDDPWWCALRAGRRQGGVIGLHAPGDRRPRPGGSAATDRPALVRLGFETSEPLDALAARLHAGGHDSAQVVADEAGSKVVLIDPDGQHLEIHPTI